MSESAQSRIDSIDFLKVVGLTGIVIAHTSPPGWLLMLRCFDVPLMVILSAILVTQSYRRRRASPNGTRGYYVGRFKRIVFPTWIFLVIYFTYDLLAGGGLKPFRYYLDSFLLTRYGIDYVWVMLIYLYSAALVPLLDSRPLSWKSFLPVAAAYLVYEVAYYLKLGTDVRFIDTTFYYIVPYGALTWLGVHYREMGKGLRRAIPVAALAVFIAMALVYRARTGAFYSAQNVKYPPRIYFLSYGVMCTFALLWFCEKFRLRLYSAPLVRWIASHSMWIYLWHILALSVVDRLGLPQIWWLKLAIVYPAAALFTLAVNRCLDAVGRKRCPAFFKYLRN